MKTTIKNQVLKASNGGYYGVVFNNRDVIWQTGTWDTKEEATKALAKWKPKNDNLGS